MKGGFRREWAKSFEGLLHQSLWFASDFRVKSLLLFFFVSSLAIAISLMFIFPSRASPSFASEKKLKFIFHIR